MRLTRSLAVPCLALVSVLLALAAYPWQTRLRAAQGAAITQSPKRRSMPSATPRPVIPNAPASAIIVNTLADGAPANNSQCTLREALLNANADNQSGSTDCVAGSGADTITFSVNGTINLTGALPDLSSNLTITGPSANLLVVRRDTGGGFNGYRIFNILDGRIVSLTGITVTNGAATTLGGGIRNSGTLTITDCTITGNSAQDVGGIYNAGSLIMTGSTLSHNVGVVGSGGLLNHGNVTATLTNCTISNNGGAVNGIQTSAESGQTATTTLTNCTVTNNLANSPTILNYNSGGGTAITQLKNTLVAANGGANFDIRANTTFISQGNNLDSDGTSGLTNGVDGNIVGTASTPINPLLAPLGNYGGATPTHLLLPGSPAINAGNNTGAPATDQRGVARPQGGTVDIGAVELAPLIVTNTNNAGAGSLRQAITDANASAGANDILFNLPAGPQTINLAGALPDFTDSVMIFNATGANNLTVRRDTGGNYRIFQINSGTTVTLSGLTMTNGSSDFGGAVNNNGTLTINDCAITASTASVNGGGVNNLGTLTINRSTISGNTAGDGAVFNQGPSLTVTSSTISGNTATVFTGGITHVNFGGPTINAVITNCTITNNTGITEGGIATVDNTDNGSGPAVTTLQNNIVANNSAPNLTRVNAGASVVSQGNNLASDNGSGLLTGLGDLLNINPLLATLGNYGGPTRTHLLLDNSPARGAGRVVNALTDQRGFPRRVGNTEDIGAVENDVVLTITPVILPNAQIAQPYSQQLSQTGGATGTITWTVSAGALPAGITLNSSTGLLAGTPTGLGTFSFTITVTSQNGLAGVKDYALVVSTCPPITVAPASLPASTSFTAYSQQLTASGGAGPYSFTVSTGALPAGLTLTSSGLLSGVPTVVGSFNFIVRATDKNLCTGQTAYTLTLTANPGLQFYPLAAPVRLLDTRPGASPNACSQPNAPIAGQTSRTQPGRNLCTIPANAQALTGNVTTVQSGGGFLTLYPSDAQQPTVASTNYGVNEVINNVFTVGLGADGAFKIFANATTDVVVDVTGYYAPPGAGGLYFHPLSAPVRLLETRAGQLVGCVKPGVPLTGGADSLQTATTACTGIPAAARSVVGNATTVGPQGTGYLTLYPGDLPNAPLVASSNYHTNQVVNGPFTVGLSNAGQFKIFTTQTTDLVVDVLGYYSTEANDVNGAGLLFNPLAHPVRLLETRPGQPVGCFKPGVPLMGGSETPQTARGLCDGVTIPASALGVVGNATVVGPNGPGFLTLWPSTAQRPLVAASNYNAGDVGNRHFIVGLGNADGAFKLYTHATSHLVLDLSGYFAP